jgi:fatty-acyl-CoA synthase
VPGEIVVRGESLLRRYYRDEMNPRDMEGWFHTGDLGHLDSEGRLIFEGRLKDMFKIGGENVAATEIEAVLAMHPDVTLAQVISVPDERLVEVSAAFVELRPGRPETDAAMLSAYCEQRLASFKIPRHWRFVTSWPMSSTKIQKFKLREQLMADLGMSLERSGSFSGTDAA